MSKILLTIRISLHITEETYAALETLAAKRHMSKSEIIRGHIEKGLSIDGHKEDIDFISQQIEQAVERQLTPRMERLISLMVKGVIASAGGYFLTVRVLESMVPVQYQQDYQESLHEARQKGIDYCKLNAREMEEQLISGRVKEASEHVEDRL